MEMRPNSKMVQAAHWLIKRLDKLTHEEASRRFDKFFEDQMEDIHSFLPRFEEAVEAYRVFEAFDID
jgi:hypothetical protein